MNIARWQQDQEPPAEAKNKPHGGRSTLWVVIASVVVIE